MYDVRVLLIRVILQVSAQYCSGDYCLCRMYGTFSFRTQCAMLTYVMAAAAGAVRCTYHFFIFIFSHPIHYLRTSSSLSFPLVTQIRGHIAGSSPPFPLRYVPSFLSREDFSLFFPRRLASNCVSMEGYNSMEKIISFHQETLKKKKKKKAKSKKQKAKKSNAHRRPRRTYPHRRPRP